MQIIKKYKFILIPAILAFLFSSFYIIVRPGEIKSDAAEYDGLANSILAGRYSLNGFPSMEREPGYPLFRAAIKIFSENPKVILWIQSLLYLFTVFLVGLTIYKIEPGAGAWGFYGAAMAYSLAFYPSVHISETLTSFLLSIIGILLISALNNPSLKYWVWISIVSGFLILTRYPYILIPAASFLVLAIASRKIGLNRKKIFRNFSLGILIIAAIVGPWLVRNYLVFREINIAGRSGAILYARAWKAEKSWGILADSYLSVFLGRGLLFAVYPTNDSIWLDQWGDWWRNEKVVKTWGDSMEEIDKNRKRAALNIIFSNFNNFSKFVSWSGVDALRLLELSNPLPQALGSPFEGTYGPLAQEGKLSGVKALGLVFVHVIQFLWFIAIFGSLYLGFKKYKYKFIPGILLICILLVHSITDNIARYGAPLQPWLLSGIFITVIYPFYHIINEKYFIKHNNSRL